jgi:hypothetical protein
VLPLDDLRLFDKYPAFFKSQPISIKGVTGSSAAKCVLAEAQVNIGSWSGTHTFIITTAMQGHEAILGIDFLKKFNVSVHHANGGKNRIRIGDVDIFPVPQVLSPEANQAMPASARATQAARAKPLPAHTTPMPARAVQGSARATPMSARAAKCPDRAMPTSARAMLMPMRVNPAPACATPKQSVQPRVNPPKQVTWACDKESPQAHELTSQQAHEREHEREHELERPMADGTELESPQAHEPQSPQAHEPQSPQAHEPENPEANELESPPKLDSPSHFADTQDRSQSEKVSKSISGNNIHIQQSNTVQNQKRQQSPPPPGVQSHTAHEYVNQPLPKSTCPAGICSSVGKTVLKPQSKTLVEVAIVSKKEREQLSHGKLLFEPLIHVPEGTMIAKSVHNADNKHHYCEMINATDTEIIISPNVFLGTLSVVEIVKEPKPHQPLDKRATPLDLDSLKINSKLSKDESDKLKSLLKRYGDVFADSSKPPTTTHLAVHTIPTGDHPPIQQQQYPIPQIAKEYAREQVEDMLQKGQIQPSKSPWRSPVVIVKRKMDDGSFKFRFCIDLRKVNEITVKDSYSLPRISETQDTLLGASWFTVIDAEGAFKQVPLAEEDRCKTAFMVDNKLYEYLVTPFGAMTAPQTMQRLMDRCLEGLNWETCLVYLDDIIVFSRSFEQHLIDIEAVLERLRLANLKLNKKCVFAMNEVDYLGYSFSAEGMRATPARIAAIASTPPPPTPKLLYSFLCSMNYYRKLIPNFGKLTTELYHMTESKKNFKWTAKSLADYDALRQCLCVAPILVHPNFSLPWIVQTDASDEAIGSVLLQEQPDTILQPVAFASRKLTKTERNYTVSERELLAITYALDQYNSYLYGRHVDIYTDHKPLVTAKSLKRPNGRLGRLFLKIVDVDYTLHHTPGAINFLPDFLSRVFKPDLETRVNFLKVSSSIDWIREQQKDLELKEVIKLVDANDYTEKKWLSITNGRRWWHECKQLYIDDGILKHSQNLIVCPAHYKLNIFKLHHDDKSAGHRGFDTTSKSIRSLYYWNYLPKELYEYCRSCPKCQEFNYACLNSKAPLKPIIVNRPWQLVGIDVTGPFNLSEDGNKYIILAIDHFTKYIESMATNSFSAEITADFILKNIICRHGMVESILSDRGVNFESEIVGNLCKLLGIEKLRTTAYHAAGDGITERPFKTIKPCIAKFVNDSHSDWDRILPMATSAYNNSYHSTIKMSPHEALYHTKPVLISDIVLNNVSQEVSNSTHVYNFVKSLQSRAQSINQFINNQTAAARDKQKQYYDRFVKNKAVYQVGDMVTIINYRTRLGKNKSYEPKHLGPYTITKQLGDLTYRLESPKLRPETVHYNRLHRYNSRANVTVGKEQQPASLLVSRQPTSVKKNQLITEQPSHISTFRAAHTRKAAATAALRLTILRNIEHHESTTENDDESIEDANSSASSQLQDQLDVENPDFIVDNPFSVLYTIDDSSSTTSDEYEESNENNNAIDRTENAEEQATVTAGTPIETVQLNQVPLATATAETQIERDQPIQVPPAQREPQANESRCVQCSRIYKNGAGMNRHMASCNKKVENHRADCACQACTAETN